MLQQHVAHVMARHICAQKQQHDHCLPQRASKKTSTAARSDYHIHTYTYICAASHYWWQSHCSTNDNNCGKDISDLATLPHSAFMLLPPMLVATLNDTLSQRFSLLFRAALMWVKRAANKVEEYDRN